MDEPEQVEGIQAVEAQRTAHSLTPPRAPLVLRIGVVGHRPDEEKRPNPDIAHLRATARQILIHVKDVFDGVARTSEDVFQSGGDKPAATLRIISSLADGADQWVTEEALSLGYELQSPLPFRRDEYAKDFVDPGKSFLPLLGEAEAVLELDGTRTKSAESYRAAGLMVLRQSDLLIAMWDGEPEQGVGGTGEMVHEALARGIPTIWIHWSSGQWQIFDWTLLERPEDLKGDWKRLADVVTERILPPAPESDGDRYQDLREVYFREKPPSLTLLGGWWSLFRDIVSGELWAGLQHDGPLRILQSYVGNFRGVDVLRATRGDWGESWKMKADRKAALAPPLPTEVCDWVNAHILHHYAWANQLSIRYANLYRSSFVLTYLLGALAVFLALVGIAASLQHQEERWPIGAELLVIGSILLLTWRSWRRRWHERWIDYRTLAERLRLARFLVLLGGGGQQATVSAHLATYGNPAATWMHWHYRAIERAAGLPNTEVDGHYLSACREVLLESLVEDQRGYHQSTASWLERVDHRLHRVATGFFSATFVACGIHFAFALLPAETVPHWAGRYLTMMNAFFPAVGAALAALRNQGEFQRVARRSKAMQEKLTRLKLALARVPTRDGDLNSVQLREVATETAQLMGSEVLDWRIVFQDRPTVLPA